VTKTIHEPEGAQRVPVVSYNRELSAAALRQLRLLASMPYVEERVVAMADAHLADGVAVGSVFATTHEVVPAALGGDIGCGMCALRFDLHAPTLDRRDLERALVALGKAIPVGTDGHSAKTARLPDSLAAPALSTATLEHEKERLAARQLGTLGGGNHFVELERDGGGCLWVLVHSGSRGMGGAVRNHHAAAAKAREALAIPALDTRDEAGRAYLDDVTWALSYARENRALMVRRVREVLADLFGAEADEASFVDVHHNFVARERHEERDYLVHRKGAVAAPEGATVIIPGSMGTASYLAEGRGDPTAFGSSSHGAGRVMSRGEARARVRPGELARAMGKVVYDERKARALVEEAPGAYRNIGEVLEDQAELVTPVVRLSPLMVLKG
jgi:tRNA-splicing ligase RtcB